MTRKALLAAALLLAFNTAGAVRVLEQVERPIELALADLTLPSADGGTISFRECGACGLSTHRLMDSTEYRVNGQTVPVVDFLRIADEIGDKPNGAEKAMAVVFLDLATGRITRIELRE
jgi:hypothetical protein